MDSQTILLVAIGIFLLQIIIMIIVIVKIRKDKRLGIPLQDEMTKQIMYRSGHIAFIISWALWLIIMVTSSLIGEISPNWEVYIGLMGMGIIYIIVTLFVKKKGVK